MKLPFYNRGFVSKLRESAETNRAQYGETDAWLDVFSGGVKFTHDSSLVVDPPPELLIPPTGAASFDAENSKRIYEWLKSLSPAIAMEERLWACLTHSVFPKYMARRWPVDSASAVHRRYLFEGKTFAALSRNGISRLWWAGYLTRDEARKNPYELTDILFLRQDIHVSLLERAIGKCGNIRTAVLDYFKENQSWLKEEDFGNRIQDILKELNLLGGVAILDALPPAELREFLKKIGSSVAKGKN